MRAVRFHEYGDLDVLRFEEVADPVPDDGEALLRVEACGLNHFDLDLRAGISRVPLNLPHISGLEVVGRIVSLAGGDSDLQVGQRVLVHYEETCGRCRFCRTDRANLCPHTRMFGVNRPGGYAELVTARIIDLLPVEDGLDAAGWAAVQIPFGTAWHLLVTRGGLRPGETVLVNAAGSGVSSAAIQIAKLAGARVIASAGSDAKLAQAREYGADEVTNYQQRLLTDTVLELTAGEGVDLVVEHVGGEVFRESLRALRSDGRLVTCGGHGGEVVPLDLIELFRSERRIIGSRTWTRTELERVVSLVGERKLRPVVDSEFPLEEAREAQARLSSRAHYGKVVLITT
jgi:NADPH:quinone reductase-like Zn-dependent oxidoreductase